MQKTWIRVKSLKRRGLVRDRERERERERREEREERREKRERERVDPNL